MLYVVILACWVVAAACMERSDCDLSTAIGRLVDFSQAFFFVAAVVATLVVITANGLVPLLETATKTPNRIIQDGYVCEKVSSNPLVYARPDGKICNQEKGN